MYFCQLGVNVFMDESEYIPSATEIWVSPTGFLLFSSTTIPNFIFLN